MTREIKIIIYLIVFEAFIFIVQILEKIKPQNPILILSGFIFAVVLCCLTIYMPKLQLENEKKRKQFISNLIHDFKTPIVAQIQITDLLLNKRFGKLTKEQSEIIKEIKNSCIYINHLIGTAFDTYINKNGNVNLVYQKINIKELSKSVIEEISCISDEKKQKVIITSNIKNGIINADVLQIKRVVINLVYNAIEHGKNNSDIYIMLDEDKNNIIFSIKNEALLFNIKELERKLFKHNLNKNIEKRGLGLQLSREIIEKHKGKMFIKNQENEICVFGFVLPKGEKINADNLCLK